MPQREDDVESYGSSWSHSQTSAFSLPSVGFSNLAAARHLDLRNIKRTGNRRRDRIYSDHDPEGEQNGPTNDEVYSHVHNLNYKVHRDDNHLSPLPLQ